MSVACHAQWPYSLSLCNTNRLDYFDFQQLIVKLDFIFVRPAILPAILTVVSLNILVPFQSQFVSLGGLGS